MRDDFAGSTIDTRWAVTDAGGRLSVAGGIMSSTVGAGAHGDPALRWLPRTFPHTAGLTFTMKTRQAAANNSPHIILNNASTLASNATFEHALFLGSDLRVHAQRFSANRALPMAFSTATWIWLRIVLDSTGALWQGSNDGITWYSLFYHKAGSADPLYLWTENFDGVPDWDYIDVRQGPAPQPVLSATPAATTPSLGAEQASGNLVVGTWYQITATQVDYFYTGCGVGHQFRAAATTALDANNKVQAITLASIHSLVGDAGSKAHVYRCSPTAAAGTVGGMAILATAFTAPTAPTYELQCYISPTTGKVTLVKRENNVETALIDTATGVTYAAGSDLMVVVGPTGLVCVYYESAANVYTQISTEQDISASFASYGTNAHGFDPSGLNTCGVVKVW